MKTLYNISIEVESTYSAGELFGHLTSCFNILSNDANLIRMEVSNDVKQEENPKGEALASDLVLLIKK